MTLKLAPVLAASLLLTWSAFAADPNQNLHSSPAALSASPSTVSVGGSTAAIGPASVSGAPAAASSAAIVLPSAVAIASEPARESIDRDVGLMLGPPRPLDIPMGEPLEDLPEKHSDLWGRIRAGFAMQEVDSALVARHEAWYLNRPDYVARMLERSRLYLYYIVEELEKRGMPTEIALLPMVESAYNPQAYSRMRAAGMWQFIPSTGKKYGLQQNFWYDGRRDVLAATQAALDYLQFLHDMFGDWELALAAYNCGEGGLQRAIAKNRAKGLPTDYSSLTLPNETRNYLPKLQAVKNIVSNLEELGLEVEPLPNEAYFTVVKAPGHIDLAKAAKLADMPVEEFRSLNPGYNRPVMINAAAREILLPIDKADEFTANLKTNSGPLVTWQSYTFKKGDTLAKVAARFRISLQRLKDVNGISGNQRPRPGRMLLVPIEHANVETNLDDTYNHADFRLPPIERTVAPKRYRVRKGDTLFSVARKYNVTLADLKTANRLKGNSLRVGQELVLNQEVRRVQHTVKPNSRRAIQRASN